MTPYSAVGYQSLGNSCCLHLQDDGAPERWYRTTILHDVTT